MTMPAVPGTTPIIATPFTDDGAIDYDSLEAELGHITNAGCEAATLFGIASEFYKLSDDERDQLVEVTTDVCAEVGLAPIISVTHEATVIAVERARAYEAAGAACIMVFPPRFLEPSKDAVVEHIRRIGEAVSVPVMVQHTAANVAVSPSEWAALHREVPNISYFKIEVQPPGPYISALLEATDGEVDVLVGDWGKQMIDAYDRGAVGVMPAVLYDELYVAIDRRYRNGDREGAIELHNALLAALNNFRDMDSSKRLLADRGVIESGHCRQPTSGLGDDVTERLLYDSHERIMNIIEGL